MASQGGGSPAEEVGQRPPCNSSSLSISLSQAFFLLFSLSHPYSIALSRFLARSLFSFALFRFLSPPPPLLLLLPPLLTLACADQQHCTVPLFPEEDREVGEDPVHGLPEGEGEELVVR